MPLVFIVLCRPWNDASAWGSSLKVDLAWEAWGGARASAYQCNDLPDDAAGPQPH